MQAQEIMTAAGGTGEFRYDGAVANRALELLGKELGMFIERQERGAPGDFSRLTDEQLDVQLRNAFRALGPRFLSNDDLASSEP